MDDVTEIVMLRAAVKQLRADKDEALFALAALVEEFNCIPGVQKTSVEECMKAANEYRLFVSAQ